MEAETKKTVIVKPIPCRPTCGVSKTRSAAPVTDAKPDTMLMKPKCNVTLEGTVIPAKATPTVYKPVAKPVSSVAHNLGGGKQVPADDTKSVVDHEEHTWRKYGQKHVKGGEYPRSYYKCTYPNCTMKKRVERRLDGQIEEAAYQGKLKHAMAQTNHCGTMQDLSLKRSSSQMSGDLPLKSNAQMADDDDAICRAESSTSKKFKGLSEECEMEKRIFDEGNDDENTKFGWRKYGQNVMKKNPYSRSYYKCTNPKCNARKYIEQSIDNPGHFITIYEGKHDHGIIDTGKTTNWDLLSDNLPTSDCQ